MMNKKSLSTGTLIALGLTVNSLYSVAGNIEKTAVSPVATHNKHSHHRSEDKLMKGGYGSNMRMDMNGMVMNENKSNLPKDCKEISEEVTIDVKAGVKYSEPYPGTVFGFNEHQWQVKPCSRITVNFSNEDDIRHQWMIHGLPTYLYPKGMFHIEVNGQQQKTGTFILSGSHYTYLVHCDIAQHMEKGMKAQLKAGNGRGDLPSIPGISNPTFPDTFPPTP